MGKVPAKFKRDAIRLYLLGMSMRKIAKFLGTSHVSVFSWIQEAGYEALRDIHDHAQVSQDFGVIEIDEMWHFVKKRNSQFGYGYALVEMPINQSPLSSVSVIKAH
jgi:transposase-like protein